ncbi:alpha/beta fold hydrolase [Halodurantibacterium flavum]|uniref:Alpha/beta fold hydrolase n=1 Tax=Halodurantibacterium flavum TaxID=1382802 RepID=A0ABW4S510_9RHOB
MPNLKTLLISGAVALGAMTAQPGALLADVNNIVLVHGANIDGTTWRKVYDSLADDEYSVTVVQLPMTSVEDDIAAVRRIIGIQEGPMILVGHSYGGLVIGEAGDDPNVRGLVYVAAFQPDVGESTGALSASMPTGFTGDTIRIFEDGHYLVNEDAWLSFVANGLSDEEALFTARSQAASNLSIFAYESTTAAWNDKPSWSAIATDDGVIAPDLQRQMAERAGSTVVEIENGHMLPMTSPDEVADVIRQAASAVE